MQLLMSNSALPRQVRAVLKNAPDAIPLTDLLGAIDGFVAETKSSESPDALLFQLEEDLHLIHHEVVDYSSLQQGETFLAILYHLKDILPSTSVISWFDLVLRPALREPKLATEAVKHAQDLVISALRKTNEAYAEKVEGFRKQLLELYLLDAFNEGSGDDVLEWAELNDEKRQQRTHWKHNLEDLLLRFGDVCPKDLFDEINEHFATPSSRLQLFILLNLLTCGPSFSNSVKILIQHPLMNNLLLSLFLDNSSTACTLGVTLIVKLLPFFAVYAPDDLKALLPNLFAILARIMCWKERRAAKARIPADEGIDVDFERELETETNPPLRIAPHIKWERLDMVFDTTISLPPSSRPYFTSLYYLYPSNTLKFLRGPMEYLTDNNLQSPYVESWQAALDQNEIRRRSENLAREHNCHPLLIWRDALIELSDPEFWRNYNISRIVSETAMLDLRNLAVALQGRYGSGTLKEPSLPPALNNNQGDESLGSDEIQETAESHSIISPRFLRPIDLSSGKAVLSLQDMIDTSIALKSNLDLEVIQPSKQWPSSLFVPHSVSSPSSPGSPNRGPVVPMLNEGQNATHVAQAISGLQREVLLLRNDLNFELWLSRENAKRIGQLYQDRILVKAAEVERQGLYNKLRKYRTQVTDLEKELREHKQQASAAKDKYADWNTELQQKLKELREEKKSWFLEAATLRTAEKEARALFIAQRKLLGDATKDVFELQTQRKENQHKIDRLKDYERQIDQHIKVQRLWNDDFAKFTEREGDIVSMRNQFKQMQLRLESMEQSQAEMQDNARAYRRQIQTLDAQLKLKQRNENQNTPLAQEIAASSAENASLKAANTKLKEENMDLKDEIQVLRAAVEVLKGRQGLVPSSPRSSPTIPAPFSLNI